MNTANAQPERRPADTRDGAQRTPALIVAGIGLMKVSSPV